MHHVLIDGREIYMKSIDRSYYYEGYIVLKQMNYKELYILRLNWLMDKDAG